MDSPSCLLGDFRPRPGAPIPLGDTSVGFYYEDPVSSTEEWLGALDTGLAVQLDTGFVSRARRVLVGDYIELRDPSWPDDQRFFVGGVGPGDGLAWLRVRYVPAAGLDPAPAVSLRAAGRLLIWVTAYENNRQGYPYVGQATVAWHGEGVASLETLEVSDGVPATVVVALAHCAAHAAGAAGALTVITSLDLDELDLVGFQRTSEGVRSVDTSFLNQDPDGAADLLRQALLRPGP